MSDQAAQLRNRAMRAFSPQPGAGPRVLVVAGGQPGSGVTTVAVQLATTWGADALRAVLIDADLQRADVAGRCGVSTAVGIGEVLLGRRSIHEALQRGPAGIQVLTASSSAETRAAVTDRTLRRLLKQIHTLAPHVDWIVADAGSQPSELGSRLWSAAERVLLVTTPEAAAIMETYALIKTQVRRQQATCPLDLVVSRADEPLAQDVHRRMDQSCRRFLGVSLGLAAALPPANADESPPASAVERLARRLVDAHPHSPERSVA